MVGFRQHSFFPYSCATSMTKVFEYIDGANLRDVIDIALDDDEGSFTRNYRYLSDRCRIWILRELKTDPCCWFIECFDFATNEASSWGLRGWGEEEDIPHTDCPLDLLALANGKLQTSWRDRVYGEQLRRGMLPAGAWLHSVSGISLSSGQCCQDALHLGNGLFDCPPFGTHRIADQDIARSLREGMGIAFGRG